MTVLPLHPTFAATETPAGPLAGVRVLDLSAYIAGPYGCTLLADQGAEVVKIEPPGGDNLRHYPSTLAAEGRAFVGVNRGKLGLSIDLKKPAGRAVLERLLREADVLVHNFRPGVPERLGIDWSTLHKAHPRLVCCALTGYGDQGPASSKAGYDQVLQTLTGICAMQGSADVPQIVYGSVVDYYAASLLAAGIASALFQRERTGKGQYVAVSLLRSALAMQSARMVWAEGEPRDINRDMRSGGITGLHPTRQGSLYLSANTPHFWTALCELTGLAHLATDPRYASVRLRAQHADELIPMLREALSARTATEWEAIFGERVPCAAARTIEDMFEHPQVHAEHMVETFEHPLLGRYRGLTRAIRFGGAEPPAPRAAPVLGEHTEALLGRHGYSAEDIAGLRAEGVLG
ncbi:MAG: CoA transferase [Variovorax paradoxus]|uniref:CoA transferase n=1 Tax=Variovorax paradoxus TaxID=34073 RepID=A0A2W5QGV7_VARPD|nr:MAG: CoA transferase [Variovorax paradoxus]